MPNASRHRPANLDQLAGWLAGLAETGSTDVADPGATAAGLLGALAFYRVMETMLGEPPGPVSDDRFLDAWVRMAVRALTPPEAATQAPEQR